MKKYNLVITLLLLATMSFAQSVGDTVNIAGADYIVIGFDEKQECVTINEPRYQKIETSEPEPEKKCIECGEDSDIMYDLAGSEGTDGFVVQVARNKVEPKTVPDGCIRIKVAPNCWITVSNKVHKTYESAQEEADAINKANPKMDEEGARAFVTQWVFGK